MDVVSITTVIPAYNEGERLSGFLDDWAAAGVPHRHLAVTAIVVDDGSEEGRAAIHRAATEQTSRRLQEAGSDHRVSYVRADRNRGKGAAIRLGWTGAAAGTTWLSFIDADGAIPAREYWRVADLLPAVPADVVCGSRIKMAGRTIERSLFRHLQGRVFATVVEELFHLGFYDTQTGMKFFRASDVRPMLPALREDRWLLDVELLVRLKGLGHRCVEVPIDCQMHGGSSMVFGVDPVRMAIQLVRLRSRLRAGRGGHV